MILEFLVDFLVYIILLKPPIKPFFLKNQKIFLQNQKTVLPLHRQKKKTTAEIAQLVEHNLAKVRVASSSLVFRSNPDKKIGIFYHLPWWWNW